MSLDPLRDARNREVMRAYNLDALVCRLPENVLLLTGYWPLSSVAFALVPREGPRALIAVNTEEAAIPAGAADEVRTFGWGVVSAVDPYGDAATSSFFLDTLETLENAYVRPRYDGFVPFREKAGSLIHDYLRDKGDEEAILDALDALYEDSQKM